MSEQNFEERMEAIRAESEERQKRIKELDRQNERWYNALFAYYIGWYTYLGGAIGLVAASAFGFGWGLVVVIVAAVAIWAVNHKALVR